MFVNIIVTFCQFGNKSWILIKNTTKFSSTKYVIFTTYKNKQNRLVISFELENQVEEVDYDFRFFVCTYLNQTTI